MYSFNIYCFYDSENKFTLVGNLQSNCCLKSLHECTYGRSGETEVWSVSCSLECPPPHPSSLAPSMTYRSVLFVFTCTHWKHVRAVQILKWCRRLIQKSKRRTTHFWKLRPPTLERLKRHKCQHSPIILRFCLDSVNAADIWKPSSRLNENLFALRQQRPASGAHPDSHADASCWALLSLDARSEFSTSINHRVPNGRLPFRMGPIAEGAAFEVVAEAALIA